MDGIDWTKVDFEDNKECLDLFEKVVLFLSPLFLIQYSMRVSLGPFYCGTLDYIYMRVIL